jgi:hypothetical protein
MILIVAACLGLGLAAAVHTVATSARVLQTRSSPPIAVPAFANMRTLAESETALDRNIARAEAAAIAQLTTPAADVPADMLPGQAERGTVRVLLDNLGPNKRAIYAYRTTKGRVCGGLTDQSSGCFDGFTEQAPVTYTFGVPGGNSSVEGLIVYGFMPDSVRSVSVVIAGIEYDATVGRNAFFVQLPSASVSPRSIEAIIVGFVNGRTQIIPIALR